MNDLSINMRDYLTGPISKRAQKLCQKLEESSEENKRAYFAKIIQEGEYNQTTNKRENYVKGTKGRKEVRKKTSEELKLLEYFLEQDSEWNRSTVSMAAKVLGLTCYQVYKWGYDRKNRKDTYNHGVFLKGVEVNQEIIEKINRLKQENKPETDRNLNRGVDQLLKGSGKYKNLDENGTEFPMDELNFLSDQAGVGESYDAYSEKSSQAPIKRFHKVFKIKKVAKRAKTQESEELDWLNDRCWHAQKDSQLLNFNNDQYSNLYQNGKNYDADINERHSVATLDKSSDSVIIKNDICDKLSYVCDNGSYARDSQEIEELLNHKAKEEYDYFDCSNLLNGVLLPGLSSNCSDDNESIGVSEKLSSQLQREDEEYFIDNFEEAQKMEVRFF